MMDSSSGYILSKLISQKSDLQGYCETIDWNKLKESSVASNISLKKVFNNEAVIKRLKFMERLLLKNQIECEKSECVENQDLLKRTSQLEPLKRHSNLLKLDLDSFVKVSKTFTEQSRTLQTKAFVADGLKSFNKNNDRKMVSEKWFLRNGLELSESNSCSENIIENSLEGESKEDFEVLPAKLENPKVFKTKSIKTISVTSQDGLMLQLGSYWKALPGEYINKNNKEELSNTGKDGLVNINVTIPSENEKNNPTLNSSGLNVVNEKDINLPHNRCQLNESVTLQLEPIKLSVFEADSTSQCNDNYMISLSENLEIQSTKSVNVDSNNLHFDVKIKIKDVDDIIQSESEVISLNFYQPFRNINNDSKNVSLLNTESSNSKNLRKSVSIHDDNDECKNVSHLLSQVAEIKEMRKDKSSPVSFNQVISVADTAKTNSLDDENSKRSHRETRPSKDVNIQTNVNEISMIGHDIQNDSIVHSEFESKRLGLSDDLNPKSYNDPDSYVDASESTVRTAHPNNRFCNKATDNLKRHKHTFEDNFKKTFKENISHLLSKTPHKSEAKAGVSYDYRMCKALPKNTFYNAYYQCVRKQVKRFKTLDREMINVLNLFQDSIADEKLLKKLLKVVEAYCSNYWNLINSIPNHFYINDLLKVRTDLAILYIDMEKDIFTTYYKLSEFIELIEVAGLYMNVKLTSPQIKTEIYKILKKYQQFAATNSSIVYIQYIYVPDIDEGQLNMFKSNIKDRRIWKIENMCNCRTYLLRESHPESFSAPPNHRTVEVIFDPKLGKHLSFISAINKTFNYNGSISLIRLGPVIVRFLNGTLERCSLGRLSAVSCYREPFQVDTGKGRYDHFLDMNLANKNDYSKLHPISKLPVFGVTQDTKYNLPVECKT